MRAMMLQRQTPEAVEPFRRAIAGGTVEDAAGLLQQAARVVGGPQAMLRLILAHDGADDRAAALELLLERLRGRGVRILREAAQRLDTARLIAAARDGHDLLLKAIAPAPRGGMALDRGDQALIDRCPCPIWMGNRTSADPPRRIVAAVAPDPADETANRLSRRVLTTAGSVAACLGSELHVVHAWVPFGAHLLRSRAAPDEVAAYIDDARRAAHEAMDHLLSTVPLAVQLRGEHVHVLQGEMELEMPRLVSAHGIDLAVMGTRGRRTRAGRALMPPHAPRVLRRAVCSALIVKP